jgi:DNA-binding transcriptional LysR family regulator
MFDRKLRYLDALEREGHFQRAASACGVSQPSLSKAIRQLERELGVTIIKRGPRFSGFTQHGQIVLAWARRLIAETDRLGENLREASQGFSGLLRVGILAANFPLMPVFTIPFSKAHPKVNLNVSSYDTSKIRKALEGGDIDIAITYTNEYSPDKYRSKVLFEENYELVMRRGSPWSRASLGWSDLAQIPLCVLPPKTLLFNPDAVELLNDVLKQSHHIVTNSIFMVMDHVRTGLWATILPTTVRVTFAGDKELEAVPLPQTDTAYPVGLVLPPLEMQSWLAVSFFNIATSSKILKQIDTLLNPAIANVRKAEKKLTRSRN